jgi:hypothetical protein
MTIESKPKTAKIEKESNLEKAEEFLQEIERAFNLSFHNENRPYVVSLIKDIMDEGEKEEGSFRSELFKKISNISKIGGAEMKTIMKFRLLELFFSKWPDYSKLTKIFAKTEPLINLENEVAALNLNPRLYSLFNEGYIKGKMKPGGRLITLVFGLIIFYADSDENKKSMRSKTIEMIEKFIDEDQIPESKSITIENKEKVFTAGEKLLSEIENETGVEFPENKKYFISMVLGIFLEHTGNMYFEAPKELTLFSLLAWQGDALIELIVSKQIIRDSSFGQEVVDLGETRSRLLSDLHFKKLFPGLSINLGQVKNSKIFTHDKHKFRASIIEFIVGLYVLAFLDPESASQKLETYVINKILNSNFSEQFNKNL